MPVAIKFENISKLYRLGEAGTGTLVHDLQRAWAKFRGKPDPFAKVGQVNDRTQYSSNSSRLGECTSYVWALKDISFEVHQGEVLGIIGRNGAGKSTLLKLLSRVTAPSDGTIKSRGRIASLLEVGTGFHPELTGRENVYLNGAILGMRRYEITKQLSDIVDFSGCAKYLDTPVKRYSSGMIVRLGFAVAAHLDCEILIVDEVLAVGDADFQNKCIGRMRGLAKESNKTVLFVSHNIAAVAQLCTRVLLMQQGQIAMSAEPAQAIKEYVGQKTLPKTNAASLNLGEAKLWIEDAGSTCVVETGSIAQLRLSISVDSMLQVTTVAIIIRDLKGNRVSVLDLRSDLCPFDVVPKQRYVIEGEINATNLVEGTYETAVYLRTGTAEVHTEALHVFDVVNPTSMSLHLPFAAEHRGVCVLPCSKFSLSVAGTSERE